MRVDPLRAKYARDGRAAAAALFVLSVGNRHQICFLQFQLSFERQFEKKGNGDTENRGATIAPISRELDLICYFRPFRIECSWVFALLLYIPFKH